MGEGSHDVTLFWLLDALTYVGVPDAVQSALFWPLIAGSVVVTELAAAVGMAAVGMAAANKMVPAGGALTLVVAAPLAVKMTAK